MIKRIFTIFIILSVSMHYSCLDKKETDNSGIQNENTIKDNKDRNNADEIPGITALADKKQVRVGEIIMLSLKFSLPEGSVYDPAKDLSGLEGLTIIDSSVSDGQIEMTVIIDKMESFDIGPISLSFKDKKGDLNIIRTEAIPIEVRSNLGARPEEARLKPIMDIIPTYSLWLKLLPWILGITAIALIIAFIYFWRKKKRKEIQSILDSKPPHIAAMEEIDRLISMNLIDKGKYKEFYFRFSGILRIYMERLRNFPAAELTTEEIMRRVRDERDRKLLPLLQSADMIKFADAIPTRANNEQDIQTALNYIRETTPIPSVADHGSRQAS